MISEKDLTLKNQENEYRINDKVLRFYKGIIWKLKFYFYLFIYF